MLTGQEGNSKLLDETTVHLVCWKFDADVLICNYSGAVLTFTVLSYGDE